MNASFARIDPTRCIGCSKCLAACPSGAVLGAPKLRHHIVASACHACGDCLPVCPTTCITWDGDAPLTAPAPGDRPSQKHDIPQPDLPPLPEAVLALAAAARDRMTDKYAAKTVSTPKVLRTAQRKTQP